jgi:hypothetical protein
MRKTALLLPLAKLPKKSFLTSERFFLILPRKQLTTEVGFIENWHLWTGWTLKCQSRGGKKPPFGL